MKLRFGDRLFSGAVVLVMTAVLVTLAMLQYRWSDQVSEATSEKMEVDLESTLMHLRDDFYREIAGFCFQLEIDPNSSARERQKEYAEQYQAWTGKAAYPSVVANVFVLQQDRGGDSGVLRLDASKRIFQKTDMPDRFARVQQRIQEISTDLAVAAARLKSTDELRQRAKAKTRRDEGQTAAIAKQFPVMIDEEVPALVQAVYHHPAAGEPDTELSEIDWIIVELNSEVLRTQIFPRLVAQYFGDPRTSVYRVAVIQGNGQSMYASSAEFPGNKGSEPDENIRLFGPPWGASLRGSDLILLPTYHTQTPDGKFHETNDLASAWPVRIEPIHYTPDDEDWQMLAQHRKGSLEAAVTYMRRRNLAVSFAVLLLLGGSMGMLLVSSRRAQTLARLQMDFVTGVSHELRTPLAVICSAADNIADGVVGDQQRMEQYGNVIKNAGRQLINLVEQILLYAATRNNRHQYSMAPLQVTEIVDSACANTASIVQEAGVKLDCYVDPSLPQVKGDPAALSHCLQNLITNAVKYGGEPRWVGIRARLKRNETGSEEIQINVEDRGIGIAARDLPHIFEPLYRSPGAVAAQIRGTGLGLALARTIAIAMGGNLTVTSQPGQGSTFVLHLPIAEQAATDAAMQIRTPLSGEGLS